MFLLLLLSVAASYTMSMDGDSCTISSNQSFCTLGDNWKASVAETRSSFSYTFAFSDEKSVSGSWGFDGSQQGFAPTWFKYTIYSVQPLLNVTAFPTLLMGETTYSCNVTTLLMQDNCVGTCVVKNHACTIGKYQFTYDPPSDQVTIQYYFNVLTVSRVVATRNNHSDANAGFIAIVWNYDELPLFRSDQFGAN